MTGGEDDAPMTTLSGVGLTSGVADYIATGTTLVPEQHQQQQQSSDVEIDLSTALEELPPATFSTQSESRKARNTPPPLNSVHSSQTLSRTLSASSVLHRVSRSAVSSPTSMVTPPLSATSATPPRSLQRPQQTQHQQSASLQTRGSPLMSNASPQKFLRSHTTPQHRHEQFIQQQQQQLKSTTTAASITSSSGNGGAIASTTTTPRPPLTHQQSIQSQYHQEQQRLKSPSSVRDLNSMKSMEDLVFKPYAVSLKSNGSSGHSRRSHKADDDSPNTSGGGGVAEPDHSNLTISYRQVDSNPNGRSNSRYYERMAARSWLPSLNVSKRATSVHIPHVVSSPTNSGNSPMASPPLTPDTTSSAPAFKVASAIRTPSFPSIVEESQQVLPSSRSVASSRMRSPLQSSSPQDEQMQQSRQAAASFKGSMKQSSEMKSAKSSSSLQTNHDVNVKSLVSNVPPLSFYSHAPKIFGEEPPRLAGHSCTLVREKLYIFGGKTEDGVSNLLNIYHCSRSSLITPPLIGDVMPPCYDHSATLVPTKNAIYFIGGADEENNCHNWVYYLNTNTHRFQKIDTSGTREPLGRRGHTTVLCGKTLYMFGGQNGDRMLNDVWKLDVSSGPEECHWSEVISLEKDTMHWPTARAYHTAHHAAKGLVRETENDSMIVFGGNDAEGNVSDEVWIFDYSCQRWVYFGATIIKQVQKSESTATFRARRESHSSSSVPSPSSEKQPTIASVPNGSASTVSTNQQHQSSQHQQHQQQQVPAPPVTPPLVTTCAKTMHCSVLLGNFLITLGGHDGNGLCSTLDTLNLHTKRWTIRPIHGVSTPGPCNHSGAILDSRFFVFGGFDEHQILAGLKIIEMPMLSFAPMSYTLDPVSTSYL